MLLLDWLSKLPLRLVYLPGPQGGPFQGFIGLASGPAGANRELIHAMELQFMLFALNFIFE